jgi:hypothetical protein
MFEVNETTSKAGDIRVIALAFFLGTFMSASAMSLLGLELPSTPDFASRDETLVLSLVASLCLAAAVAPLAKGIGGSRVMRFFKIAAFTYVSFAVISLIEAAVYSTFGGAPTILVVFAPPCLLAAAATTWLVPPADESIVRRTGAQGRSLRGSWWRLLLALLALPAVEIVTGLLAQPLLTRVVHEAPPGLVIPAAPVVMRTLLLKSVLLLAVIMPIVLHWMGSRRFLILALGLALFVLTGLVGLLQATWWPIPMRIALSTQILVASLAYAAVVVALLTPKPKIASEEPAPEVLDDFRLES